MRKDAQGHPIIDNLAQVDEYLKPRNEAAAKEQVYELNERVTQIDHLAAATVMIEFINSIPKLDHWIKDVLIMRIGRPALNGKKMSYMAIAIELGMTVKEVKECEKAGIAIANEWLERVTIVEGASSNHKVGGINDTLNKIVAINN